MSQTTKQASHKFMSGLGQNRIFIFLTLLFLGVGTGLISMMLGASYFGLPMFFSYFSSPLLLLLNILPPVMLMFFAYFVSGRVWVGFFVACVIVLGLSLINFFKIQIRHDPFIASDIFLAKEARKVISGYALIINWKIIFAAVFLVLGTAFSIFFLRLKPCVKIRFIGALSVLVASALMYGTLYASAAVYESAKGSYPTAYWSETESSIARGFLYPYIYSIRDTAVAPAIVYNETEVAAALNTYSEDSIAELQKVNIVSIMLESYCDLSTFDAVDLNVDVYGPLHDLQKESVYGSLVVNTFAGGTTDSERSYLTGYTELGDFNEPTNSYVRYLGDQGYFAEGIHVGDGWYYDRDIINPNLGFDQYYFLEDFENSNRTDAFFFPKVLELYESRDTTVPYFSYNLSYENHGPYDSTTTGSTAYLKQGTLSDESYYILNNYLPGVAATTQHVSDFIDYFRSLDEPVVIVIFGDHKPWLGNDNTAYLDLGINIDISTEEGFKNFYTTQYIIWANDAAKSVLGNDFTGYGGDFSPCFLMNKLFDLCSWGGNTYMKAANELRAYTSIVNTATGYFSENDVLTTALSDEADGVYQNFKKIEYSWQHNLNN